jgi:hypothetical protein
MSEPRYPWLAPVLLVGIALAGFLVPFWPFALLAGSLAGALRRPVLGIAVGLIFDLLWGIPTGYLGYLYFPLTLAALFAWGARLAAERYFFRRGALKTLY